MLTRGKMYYSGSHHQHPVLHHLQRPHRPQRADVLEALNRGTLRNEKVGAKQQLVIICVHDELWNMQYAPPAELPISTTKQPIV